MGGVAAIRVKLNICGLIKGENPPIISTHPTPQSPPTNVD